MQKSTVFHEDVFYEHFRPFRHADDVQTGTEFDGIAEQLRAMKRIWVGTTIEQGMNRRRDAEADLVLTAIED